MLKSKKMTKAKKMRILALRKRKFSLSQIARRVNRPKSAVQHVLTSSHAYYKRKRSRRPKKLTKRGKRKRGKRRIVKILKSAATHSKKIDYRIVYKQKGIKTDADKIIALSMRHAERDYDLDKEGDYHFIRQHPKSSDFFQDAKAFAAVSEKYQNFLLNFFQVEYANCNSISPCWLCLNMVFFLSHHGRKIENWKRVKIISKKEERMKEEGLFAKFNSCFIEKVGTVPSEPSNEEQETNRNNNHIEEPLKKIAFCLFKNEEKNENSTIEKNKKNAEILLEFTFQLVTKSLKSQLEKIKEKKKEEIVQYLMEHFLDPTEEGLPKIEEMIKDLVIIVMKAVENEVIERERIISSQLNVAYKAFHNIFGFWCNQAMHDLRHLQNARYGVFKNARI